LQDSSLHSAYKKKFTTVMQKAMEKDNIGIKNAQRINFLRIKDIKNSWKTLYSNSQPKNKINESSFEKNIKSFNSYFINSNIGTIFDEQEAILCSKQYTNKRKKTNKNITTYKDIKTY
jgi:hypothetical protein